MIDPDNAPVFPICPTFGFVAEPNFLVKIVAREGGFERRQRVWSQSLTKYTAVPSGDQAQADIEQVYGFWMAVGGMSNGFRFKDWLDYKSCDLDQDPSVTDQPIVSSGDSPASFRLVKEYIAGPFTQQRVIQRPRGSTIEIANEVGATQDPANWTLDEATGVLTIGGSFAGTPATWGGEFDVWVRFDGQLNPSFSNYRIANVTVQLCELRQPLA
jgi:uncharacterized protein (TIGR02217 family)